MRHMWSIKGNTTTFIFYTFMVRYVLQFMRTIHIPNACSRDIKSNQSREAVGGAVLDGFRAAAIEATSMLVSFTL
jgi:hypothetical protein